jgi:hypothetical protein
VHGVDNDVVPESQLLGQRSPEIDSHRALPDPGSPATSIAEVCHRTESA